MTKNVRLLKFPRQNPNVDPTEASKASIGQFSAKKLIEMDGIPNKRVPKI